MATRPSVTIYTDGSCVNPGPGGYAAVIMYDVPKAGSKLQLTKSQVRQGHSDLISSHGCNTTNNRMELAPVIVSLESLNKPCNVTLYSDSKYVINGITKWVKAWKKRDWKTTKNKPVENRDLWERLERAISRHAISWNWIKGHSEGSEHAFWNGVVDMIAGHEKEKSCAENDDRAAREGSE